MTAPVSFKLAKLLKEKSFDAGHRICKGGFMYIPSKRDYISNLKLDI